MIIVIGGKTIKGNIDITVHSEKEDVPDAAQRPERAVP